MNLLFKKSGNVDFYCAVNYKAAAERATDYWRNILESQADFLIKAKWLFIGLRENDRRLGERFVEFYVDTSFGRLQVVLETHSCSTCGSTLLGCNAEIFDIYIGSADAGRDRARAKELPAVVCPVCKSNLARKYVAAYCEDKDTFLAV